jgi:very-short-patch-repair endonuclease
MDWWSLARAQAGVVTRQQLHRHGISEWTVSRMLAAQQLDRVAQGVFLARGAPLTYRARLWAATLGTGGVLSFATAADLWGITERRSERPAHLPAPPLPHSQSQSQSRSLSLSTSREAIHVVLPHSRRVYPPRWVRVHRVPLPSAHVSYRAELPITSIHWTVFDHMSTLSVVDATRLADRALQRGWITSDQLDQRLREHPRRHGNRLLRALQAITADGAAAESERRLHQLLHAAGFRDWKPNYPVWFDGALVAVVDLAIPSLRIAIEIDGMAYHVDPDRFQRDRSRQNDLVMLGWTVLRFTWADLTERPEEVIARIRQVAAA